MRRFDQITGLIWFALGSGMTIEGIKLGLGKLQLPGVGFMPFLVGGALGSCGFVLTVLATLKEKGEGNEVWREQNWRNLVLPLLSLLLYVLLLESLGFLVTTFLFQFFLLKLTAPKRWLSPALTSLVIAFCSYFVFSLWLKIPLPKGIWGIG